MSLCKKALSLYIVILFVFSLTLPTAFAFEKSLISGDSEIKISRDADPDTGATVDYSIEVTGGDGKPVSGAKLKLEAQMVTSGSGGHGNMDMGNAAEPIIVEASESEPGHYRASLDMNMAGEWEIFIGGNSKTGMLNANFTENILSAGPNWTVIGTFIAIVVGIGVLFTSRNRAKLGATSQRETLEEVIAEEF